MRRHYPAIFERSKGGYGVWFPDIAGCTSGGDTLEEAAANAAVALELWFAEPHAGEAPAPSTFEQAKKRVRAADVVMFVSANVPERTERIAVSMSDVTLALADRLAAERGTTRSGLLSELVRAAAASDVDAPVRRRGRAAR